MNKSQNTKTENGISSVYISHYTSCHHVGCSHLGIIELPSSWLLKLPKSVEKHYNVYQHSLNIFENWIFDDDNTYVISFNILCYGQW